MKQSLLTVLTLVGSLAVSTNPSLDDYQVFVRKIIIRAGEKNPVIDLMHHTPLSPLVETFVIRHTQRRNYVFFSHYYSELNTYVDGRDLHVSSIAGFGNFFILDCSLPWEKNDSIAIEENSLDKFFFRPDQAAKAEQNKIANDKASFQLLTDFMRSIKIKLKG